MTWIGRYWLTDRLARLGYLDADRGRDTVDLAWPRVITGFARLSQQIADLAMIGLVLGPPALAGMAFAFAYWQIGNQLSLGLSGGTISLVSQRFGAGLEDEIDLAIKQSVWIAVLLALPITVAYWSVPAGLIRLLGAGAESVAFGAVYLKFVSLAIGFEFLNKIASRVLVGVDDAVTPMFIRGGGAAANVVLNAVFIFVLGLGVLGAALGTLVATVLTTGLFVWGFSGRTLPVVGGLPVRVRAVPPFVERGVMRDLVVVSAPLMVRSIARSLVIFPLLAIVSVFGSGTVAAFEVARRTRRFMNAPAWGLGLASSSLVGRELGKHDEEEAAAYGWDIIRLSAFVYVAVAVVVLVFARPFGRVFVAPGPVLDQTETFIRFAAVSVVPLGIDVAVAGSLRGAGDTRWPLYAKLVGSYLVALPVAFLGVTTPLGLVAIYAAFVLETLVPMGINAHRYRTGRWIQVSRRFRPDAEEPPDG